MGDLQQIISDLINQHGQETVQEAVNKHLAANTSGATPTCPTGYYLDSNGNCVKDVG